MSRWTRYRPPVAYRCRRCRDTGETEDGAECVCSVTDPAFQDDRVGETYTDIRRERDDATTGRRD